MSQLFVNLQTFYDMKNRIRKKVEIVKQCNANPSDNLSDLDLKIHEMSPNDECDVPLVFNDLNWDNSGGNAVYSDNFQGEENIIDTQEENHMNNVTDTENFGIPTSSQISEVHNLEEPEDNMIDEEIYDDIEEQNPSFVTVASPSSSNKAVDSDVQPSKSVHTVKVQLTQRI